MTRKPHVLFFAIGFPPAAESSAHRLREFANQFCEAGWDVTVVNIEDSSWERDFGLDHTLSAEVDPRVRIVKLPLAREELETDLRTFGHARALDPIAWQQEYLRASAEQFPEPTFGCWRHELEEAAFRLHDEHPADLMLVSCAPYVLLAVARRLWEERSVAYAVDFRDGWSVDVIRGKQAFTPQSDQGVIELQVLEDAVSVSFVNEPIADFYRQRYPHFAERMHVVRNGFDPASIPSQVPPPKSEDGLVFGFLGEITFPATLVANVLDGWRIARELDPLIRRSRLEFRGHVGAGARREANAHMDLLRAAEDVGVHFGGPAPKGDLARLYGTWDALLLIVMGGRYMTCGKLYEYMATGLPIVSAHAVEHDATTALEGRPLWTGPTGFEVERIARGFIEAGAMAISATDADHEAARRSSETFSRPALMKVYVDHVTRQMQIS